jgi:AcrR family transcriptional regulator
MSPATHAPDRPAAPTVTNPSPHDEAPRPMRKDAARNRELLIAAAREVFAQRGLDASLDDVARHAGLGVGTAYRHFANKWEVASALIDQAIERLVCLADAALAVQDPWEGLVGFLTNTLAVQANDRGLREVMTGVHDPKRLERIHGRMSATIGELLRRGKVRGEVREDAEPSDVWFLIAMMCAVAELAEDAAPDIWRRYLAMAMAGLRPGSAMLPMPALGSEDFMAAVATHHARNGRSRTSAVVITELRPDCAVISGPSS